MSFRCCPTAFTDVLGLSSSIPVRPAFQPASVGERRFCADAPESGEGLATDFRVRTMTLETRPPQLTICVLGGTGFVGAELITHLAKDGHWIRVPTRSAADNDFLRVLDTVQLIGILNEEGRSQFKSVHVDLAEKVVTAARNAEVSRLLHMSSLAADATAAPSKYLRSKGEAEAKVRASAPFTEMDDIPPLSNLRPRRLAHQPFRRTPAPVRRISSPRARRRSIRERGGCRAGVQTRSE
jgi:hypothetical protein